MHVHKIDLVLSKYQISILNYGIKNFGNLVNFKTALYKDLMTKNLTQEEKEKTDKLIKNIEDIIVIVDAMTGEKLEIFTPISKLKTEMTDES